MKLNRLINPLLAVAVGAGCTTFSKPIVVKPEGKVGAGQQIMQINCDSNGNCSPTEGVNILIAEGNQFEYLGIGLEVRFNQNIKKCPVVVFGPDAGDEVRKQVRAESQMIDPGFCR